MDIDKKARELMAKYPNMIRAGELSKEVPNDKDRREVFSRMVYLAQVDANNSIFGA
jgi:hypothetical protein